MEIARRADLGMFGYEKIVGTIHFAVDPKDPHNRLVVDLDKAPVNAAGRVEFSSDLYILRPKPPRGNGAALVDILNRGNKVVLNGFNRGGSPDPASDADLGDRFLMRFGYTLVWVGWEFDVPDRPLAMRIHVPVATDKGKAIAGVVRGAWTANHGREGIRRDRSGPVRRQRSRRSRQLAGRVSSRWRRTSARRCGATSGA